MEVVLIPGVSYEEILGSMNDYQKDMLRCFDSHESVSYEILTNYMKGRKRKYTYTKLRHELNFLLGAQMISITTASDTEREKVMTLTDHGLKMALLLDGGN